METLRRDLRYAFRGFRRSPGFALIVILTLGLGIGANTAVFSVIESVLLRPLPFQAPERLISVWATPPNSSTRIGASGPEFQDYKEQSRSFEYIADFLPRFTYTWTGRGEPRTLICTGISPDFFPMLGVQPHLGRIYTVEEYHVDGVQVVISERFWKQQLGGDPHIIGRVLDLDGTSQVVIGVMPQLPDLFPDTDVWAKVVPEFKWMRMRGNRFLSVIGRLRPGITREQAEQELTTILRRGPGEAQDVSVRTVPLKDELVGKVRTQLEIVMAAVALVLLVTCVNVAYLLLARNSKRQSEIAIRWSMGASQGRILRQLVTENLVLAVLGGILGFVLAVQSVKALAMLNVGIIPRASTIHIDGYVLSFALIIIVLMSVFLAGVPCIAFVKRPLYATLKTGRGQMGTLDKSHFRTLLISEVSLTVVLLVAAGLLLRSFWRVAHLDLGFQPDHLLSAYLRTNDYPDGRKFFPQLLQHTAELPGVRATAVSDCMPATAARSATLKFDDRPNDPYTTPVVQGCWVSPDFFQAIGTPMLEGRSFTARDDQNGPLVVIVNTALAQAYWAGQSPLGKHIATNYLGAGRSNSDVAAFREVVGVVADVRQRGLESPVEPAIYLPYLQDETNHVFAGLNWFVRSNGDPRALEGLLRPQIHQLRPNQPVDRMQTMEDSLFKILAPRRFILALFGSFAGLALLLSAIGIFGMIAYSVSRRIPEMGVRIALGAQRSEVRRLILQEGMLLTGIGILLGTIFAAIVTRAMSALLFRVRPSDPISFVMGAAIILVVAAAACAIPAWRAGSVDPMSALRME